MAQSFACAQGHRWDQVEIPGAGATGGALACPVCGAAPSWESLGAPKTVAAVVDKLRDELTRIAGKNFAGFILYGGLARGRFHPDKSDINVVVLLHEVTAGCLAAIAPAIRAAWRAARVEPLFLTPGEVRATAAAFPTKFLDIRDHHVVLAGEDPFVGLEAPRERLRIRVEQGLRNSLLRLRRRFVAVADDPAAQAATLVDISRSLAIDLRVLLQLAGKELPGKDRSAAVFEAAAREFDLDGEALGQVAALRAGAAPGEDLGDLYQHLLATVARAAEVVARMREGSA